MNQLVSILGDAKFLIHMNVWMNDLYRWKKKEAENAI